MSTLSRPRNILAAAVIAAGLTACTLFPPVSKDIAAACIGAEVNQIAEQAGRVSAILGINKQIPTFSVAEIAIGECRETAVSEHTCLVEYTLKAEGGGEEVNAFITQVEALLGRKLTDKRQQRWAFTKGPSMTTCRRID
ncbi:MAG: hypothetical protein WAT70_02655 [Rhizobiaceae bacterium]